MGQWFNLSLTEKGKCWLMHTVLQSSTLDALDVYYQMSHWTNLVYFIYIFIYIKYIHTYKVYYYSESTTSITPPFRDNSVLQE